MQTNTTKLFRELRKLGVNAKQKIACCRSCTPVEVQVYNTQQTETGIGIDSYIYYDKDVVDKILFAATKAGVALEWDGDTSSAILVKG